MNPVLREMNQPIASMWFREWFLLRVQAEELFENPGRQSELFAGLIPALCVVPFAGVGALGCRIWLATISRIGEIVILTPYETTVEEVERWLELLFLEHPVQRLRPLESSA